MTRDIIDARGRRRSRLATLADVAARAGVSQSAVSRTFTAGASVSEATRKKVLEASAALKYRPNQLARSLMTRRSNTVGVAITALDNQFYPKLLEQLSDRLAQAGYRILLFVTHGERDHDPVLDEVLRYRVDALVLASSSLSSRLAAECRQAGVPTVMVNNVGPGEDDPCVVGENLGGGRAVADFLIAGGHQRFAFVAGVEGASTSAERERGYADALVAQGLAEPRRAVAAFTFGGGCEATRALLSSDDPPDAIFCVNDHMAFAALQTAVCEFGLTPGREVSIVGFDDAPIAAWPMFDLTTYSQPCEAIADQVLDLLGDLLEERDPSQARRIIAGELIVRGTARIPPGGTVVGASGRRVWRPM